MKALNTNDLQVVSGGATEGTSSNALSNVGTGLEHAAASVFSTGAGAVLTAAEMVNNFGSQVLGVLGNMNHSVAETLSSLRQKVDTTAAPK